jgi:hypothetical protein
MEIRISGKLDRHNRAFFTKKESAELSYIGDGFVFVDYLDEGIFLGDIFILENGTEIILKEIKLQFDTKEPLTEMGSGWKCLCKFDNLDLKKIPTISAWNSNFIIANRKEI